jgi:hypothetical protein
VIQIKSGLKYIVQYGGGGTGRAGDGSKDGNTGDYNVL